MKLLYSFHLTNFFHLRTYNQLWFKTQQDIQKVLENESTILIGRAEKVLEI